MELSYTYFQDEIREGFYISGSVKRAWAAQLEVLDAIDAVCKKHHIKWFADCGTLLGAVRHGGYIPWDDDLDICMLRDDYTKFCAVAKAELPQYYEVLTMHDEDPYYEYFARVTNGHRMNFDEDYLDKYHNCPYVVGIDVFPLDYILTDKKKEESRDQIAKIVKDLADNVVYYKDDDPQVLLLVREVENMTGYKVDKSKPIRKQLFQITEKLFMQGNARTAKEVVLMPFWVDKGHHRYPIRLFKNVVYLPFEETRVPVSACYEEMLKLEYGNYMRIIIDGGMHNYPFFNKQEEQLKGLFEKYPFEYQYDSKMLEARTSTGSTFKNNIQDIITMLNEAHIAIVSLMSAGNIDVCQQILASCQDGAISAGNMIEKELGEGYVTVSVLEEYCELVYEISQVLKEEVSPDIINVVTASLNEIYIKLKENVDQNIMQHKEVVFMPFGAEYWDVFAPYWEAACADPNTDVYVVPIPVYERGPKGEFLDSHYDISLYPENLNIISYEQYNVKQRHPDTIYIQNPYDEYNYTLSVAPLFYSSRLKGYTDELIYIPFFILDQLDVTNAKQKKTLDYFCKMPAPLYADKVILPSEHMRNVYIESLIEMAGEEARAILEEKIIVNELSSVEMLKERSRMRKIQYLQSMKDRRAANILDNEDKLTVLLTVNVSSLFQDGNAMIQKLRRCFETFETKKNQITILCYLDAEIERNIRNYPSNIAKEYYDIIDKYKNEDWCIIDSSMDYKQFPDLCDAYYGEGGYIARAFAVFGKPVMLMDMND